MSSSDNSKITTITLTGNKDYIPWSRSIQIALSGRGKLGFIDGTIKKPKPAKQNEPNEEEKAKIAEWQTTDHLVMSMLINTMEPQIARLCMLLSSSKAVWDKVKRLYGQQQNFAHIFNLKQELSQIKQGSKSSSQYGTEVLTRWEELQIYLPPTADPEEIQKRAEQDLIYTYLGGLDSSYEAIKSQILSSPELPSIDSVMATIEREETRRSNMNAHNTSDTAENKAFVTRNPNPRGAAKTRGTPATDWCDHCKRAGHNRDGCWVLHPHLRPARSKGERGSSWGSARKAEKFGGMGRGAESVSNEGAPTQITQPDMLQKKSDDFGSSVAPSMQLAQLMSQLSTFLQQHASDSGATDHMTWDLNKLQNLTKLKEPQHVIVANGNKAKIFGTGTTNLLNKNVKDDRVTGKKIGEGMVKNGLYYLEDAINRCFVSVSPVEQIEEEEQGETSTTSSGGESEQNESSEESTQEEVALRRSIRQTRRPAKLRDYVSHQVMYPIQDFLSYKNISPAYRAYLGNITNRTEPTTFNEANQDPIWRKAIKDELQALEKNDTWDVVCLPKGKKPVGCKWVYKIKYNSDGTVERYKARLVAKGFTQTYGIDYQETFAPVAKMNTVRILLSVATNLGWNLFQMDVKNAFLQGILEEEVYMTLPPGHKNISNPSMVCKLKKAIYGLKQSPRAWYAKLSFSLLKNNFIKSTADSSLFVKQSQNYIIIILVYVDDIIITGNNDEEINKVKLYLKNEFDIKDLGKLSYFLGIEIAHSSKGLFLSQRKYILDLLKETGKLGAKPVGTPMETNVKLGTESGELLLDIGQYQRLVGKLIYLTVTRPDITFAVSVISQFMHAPRTSHLSAIERILRYLKGTPGQGIWMRKNNTNDVVGFSDADWAGSCDRKSTTGFCTFVGGNLVTWKSKKQNVVARSSAEAEYRAMASTASELIWIKQLLSDMKIENAGAMKMFCDNQAARHIASNPVFHERIKHIEVDCHFVREKVQSGEIETPFVKSKEQLADIFTKALDKASHQNILGKLGLINLFKPNLRGSVEKQN
ncbi:uncharacterized protein LOC144555617 [Carex rostrata]